MIRKILATIYYIMGWGSMILFITFLISTGFLVFAIVGVPMFDHVSISAPCEVLFGAVSVS
mgnify:CR=1 FL=1